MIRKVALLLAAVFAMVALACEPAAPAVSPTVAPTATPSPTPTPTPTPTPAAAPSPEQLAVAVKAAIEKAKSFHVDMTMDTTLTSQGLTLQVPFKFDGDFQAPGSMKGALTVAVLGFTIQSEFVQIGDKSWVKDPQTGQWQDSSGESGVAPISPGDLLGETILSADSPVTDFQLVGAETLDGSGVYHYSGTIKAEELDLKGGDLKFDLYVGSQDLLPRKVTMAGKLDLGTGGAGGAPVPLSGPADFVLAMTFSNFGVPVQITPPPGF